MPSPVSPPTPSIDAADIDDSEFELALAFDDDQVDLTVTFDDTPVTREQMHDAFRELADRMAD